MAERVVLPKSGLEVLREVDARLVSYNVEMTEVTGGTFWRSYTPEQIAGTEEFPQIKSFAEMDLGSAGSLMEEFPPADLANPRLIALAKEIGPAWVRVSGSWATDTYYDFDGHTGGVAPEGFRAVLTREMWEGVLDFTRAIGAKLMISVANCPGVHDGKGPWKSDQAKIIFDFSRDYGVPISAAEFMNEPNMITTVKIEGYGMEEYARDQDLFARFIRENYPETKVVALSACGDPVKVDGKAVGIANVSEDVASGFGMKVFSTQDFVKVAKEVPDVFSYHCYNGVSERLAVLGAHWDADKTLSEEYLNVAPATARFYRDIRDEWAPGTQMWVTEAGDAGGGGDTWASTFMDVFRTLNELGTFATITDGIIFHNTLTSSDYGYLDRRTHLPRPNFWAVTLWNRIMGTTVYDAGQPVREGAHVFVHSRRDGNAGYASCIINNSKTETTQVELSSDADVYVLSADDLRASTMRLNGKELVLGADDAVPALDPVHVEAGELALRPCTIAFVVQ